MEVTALLTIIVAVLWLLLSIFLSDKIKKSPKVRGPWRWLVADSNPLLNLPGLLLLVLLVNAAVYLYRALSTAFQ
jgi:hypothetical protein